MDNRPPTVDAAIRSATISPAEFDQALREATVSSQRHGFGPHSAKIADLRRVLGGRVSREDFGQGLRHLRHEAIVELAPHGHPELLTLFEVRNTLQDGGSILHLGWIK